VADRAIRREPLRHVRRCRRVVEIRLMAPNTSRRRRRKLTSRMASRASHRRVEPGQRECRERVVVERHRRPVHRRMARRASRREIGRYVRRVVRVIEICRMAANARDRQRCVVVRHVALGAGHRRVEPGQRERRVVVIKHGTRPAHCRVAGRASRRETGSRMRRAVRVVVIRRVAAYASNRQRREIVVHMARRALHCRMESRQWERRVVVVKG